MREHEHLARRELDGFYGLDIAFLFKAFETAVEHGLVQLSLGLEVLSPDTYVVALGVRVMASRTPSQNHKAHLRF